MTQQPQKKTMKLLALLGLSLAAPSAHGFTVTAPSSSSLATTRTSARLASFPPTAITPPSSTAPSTSRLSMSLSLDDLDFGTSELLAMTDSTGNSLVQEEMLNGLSHALLDFATLFGGATVVIRAAAVVGRLFVVATDVGHSSSVLPDEWAFQLGLLLIAMHSLASASLPKIQARLAPPLLTGADRQAYRVLFRPAGISWHQYRQLYVSSMDWVTVEPGHVIVDGSTDSNAAQEEEEDAVYWLHRGDVQIFNSGNDTCLHKISGRNHKEMAAGLGLLGEMKLAHLLDKKHHNKKSSNAKPASATTKQQLTAVAGEAGATLLRMNTTKLQQLLKHDQELSNSVSRLAFKGMQDKLDALLLLQTPQ